MKSLDSCILNGEEVGARLTIEIGLQLVPTAYRLSTLQNEGNGLDIRNWCLQASNDGKRWTTLSVHKDSILPKDASVTIPLSQRNFRFWSKPLSGDANTSTLIRPLSIEAVNEASTALNIASVSTPAVDVGEGGVVLSFHIFRIMDLTALPKQTNLIIKGFELFGTVNFAHPSLLSQEKLAGLPVRFRSPKKSSSHAPITDLHPDSLKSEASQPGDPTPPFSDIEQSTHLPANEDVHGPLSAPLTGAQYGETAHPSVERRALEFAEAIDALIASNILRDMNESLTSLENQSPKKQRARESPRSYIISGVHAGAPGSENSLFSKEPSEKLEKPAGETTVRSVTEVQDGQKLENKEAGIDAAVDSAPLPPYEDPGATGISASSGTLTTAELYMLNQMNALREGRELNQLDLESGVSMFPLVPGLIPNFDPNAPQARPSSSNFHLRISPDCMLSPELFYQKKKEYDLRMELFARRKDDSVAASVYIDDLKAPIFKYILVLAEKTLYSEKNGETTADGLPLVEISLEYSFCTPGGESKYDEPKSQSTSLLTSRDVRLIGAQENQLKRLGILSSEKAKSTKESTEELLELLQLLAKLTGVGGVADEGRSNSVSEIGSDPSISARDFISFSLSRKLTRQLQDALAVAAGPALPDWCTNLTQRVTALFPYNIRYHLFRACAFGPARSLLWLQSNATPSQSISEDFSDQRRLPISPHTSTTRPITMERWKPRMNSQRM
ncbi:E3 ubiquitin-protein ligase Ufd4 [Taenia crassiceps]|uniref:E3 ubiquitin-protein ligase n=1 Tax=Taenia crassiceps TaxID=6207 RepID=A0ABR4QGZ2_9CEST